MLQVGTRDSSKEDVLMQDDESTTSLHKNRPLSVGNGSKHIKVRCFFAVDKINQKEAMIVHCPTEKMVADFSTKPLQSIH